MTRSICKEPYTCQDGCDNFYGICGCGQVLCSVGNPIRKVVSLDPKHKYEWVHDECFDGFIHESYEGEE